MSTINRPRPHTTTPDGTVRRQSRRGRRPARRPNDQLVSEAVVAAYIQELSGRRHRPAARSAADRGGHATV
jgi:hypothetical protein